MTNIPYTYLLKHIPTNTFYYGVRYASNCNPNDLWKTYFSSSVEVKRLIKEYGKESFLYEIRRTFTNKEDAIKWEYGVLQKMNVVNNDKWINKTSSQSPPIRDIRGNNNPMRCDLQRRRMVEDNPAKRKDVRLKISNALIGRSGTFTNKRHTHETKLKMKEAWEKRKDRGWIYIPSNETKQKISKALKNRVFSDEHKLKISNSKKTQNARGKNPSAKPIMYNGIKYECIRDAADANSTSVYLVKKTMILL